MCSACRRATYNRPAIIRERKGRGVSRHTVPGEAPIMVSTETLAKTARLRAICKHQSHPLNATSCCHSDAGPVDFVAVAFLLVLTSTFMIASMSTRGGKRSQSRSHGDASGPSRAFWSFAGWALGQITTIWTLPTTTTASCPDKVPTGSTCQVVSTVTGTFGIARSDRGLYTSDEFRCHFACRQR